MTPVIILCGAALVCLIGVCVLLWLLFKYKDETFAPLLWAGAVMLGCLCAASVTEAVKKAEEYEKRQLDAK